MSQVILFERDEVERLDDLAAVLGACTASSCCGSTPTVTRGKTRIVSPDALELDEETRDSLVSSDGQASFHDHGRYIHVTAFAPDDEDDGSLIALEVVVGDNWVVTSHDRPIGVLDEFAARASGSGHAAGLLDGPSFLAALFDWVLGAYSAAFERIEHQLEEFDVNAMRGEGDPDRDIERLVDLRTTIGELRRALAARRPALVSLSYPELKALGDERSSERFRSLLGRFESTMQEARDAREAVVGSFDVLIARGGHRTNEIMKVDARIRDPAAGCADRGRDGDELQGGAVRRAGLLLGGARGDRGISAAHPRGRKIPRLDLTLARGGAKSVTCGRSSSS